MEKTTETYLPSQITANIGKNLKILMTINRIKYNLPLDSLFSLAARENLKREFLFVSKVLGKHIPINPLVLKIIGGILARAYQNEIEGIVFEDIDLLVDALISLQPENSKNTITQYDTERVI